MKEGFVRGLQAYRNDIGWPSLGEWVAHFTGEAARGPTDGRLVVGIDECAKHPAIVEAAESLERDGLSRDTRPLWQQLREMPDGTPLLVSPATRRFPYTRGRPDKTWSSPDSHVIRALVTLFTVADRVVLLSTNTRQMDRGGLRYLLQSKVRPALAEHHHGRFSLLAVLRQPGADDVTFAGRILPTVLAHPFEPGFTELVI